MGKKILWILLFLKILRKFFWSQLLRKLWIINHFLLSGIFSQQKKIDRYIFDKIIDFNWFIQSRFFASLELTVFYQISSFCCEKRSICQEFLKENHHLLNSEFFMTEIFTFENEEKNQVERKNYTIFKHFSKSFLKKKNLEKFLNTRKV